MIQKIIRWLKKKYNECFFIGSTDKLPPPLEKEEELSCLILAKQGDEEAKNKLIEHNLRLVVFLAKKYENTGYEMEDLVSIGSIGLIKGIETYKIDKNINNYFKIIYKINALSNHNEILLYLKTLKNNLKEYDWNAILSVLNQYQLSEHVRAEEIAPELFQEIYLKVSK